MSSAQATVYRERKSRFVKLFDKTPEGVVCPHFYELVLSNGCPYDCSYCYLRLTFRGHKSPTMFTNGWDALRQELDASPPGVYSTGELADSLAVIPPHLPKALDYFSHQDKKTLLLVTKSVNVEPLLARKPSPRVIVSFSINSVNAARRYEHGAPSPLRRIDAARRLNDAGWRVRVRLDPLILEPRNDGYQDICRCIRRLAPELVTVGSLRQYPQLRRFAPRAPSVGLAKAADGRMRYPHKQRVSTYRKIAEWLGQQPGLCKETQETWESLGWTFQGCNCTP